MSESYRVAVLLSTSPVLGLPSQRQPEEFVMPTEFVMLPPQTDQTREWGARLAAAQARAYPQTIAFLKRTLRVDADAQR